MIQTVICLLLQIAILVFFLRAVLSWFPLDPDGVPAKISGALYTVTEPVLGPIRQLIPPAGGFDLSFIVVVLGIFVLQQVICG